jgi:hypothetical protein
MPTRGTPTLDTRTPLEKCVESRGVKYVVTGEGVLATALTWQNDTGGTEQGEYGVPFCKQYTGFESGDFVYISAQFIRATNLAKIGNITCRIYDGDSIIAEGHADGFASIATCSGAVE